MKKHLAALSGAMLIAAAIPASAATLLFQLSGSKNATFELDSNPTPDTSNTSFLGLQIQFLNVAGNFGGVPGIASSIGFGTGPILAQLNINGTSLNFTQFAGPDLFTGTATSPVFAPGSFALTSIVSGASNLVISALPAPEPANVLVTLGIVGMLGIAGRLRRRTAISV